MAREQELIKEIRQPERPKYEYTESTHADVLVDTVVEFLRQCFQQHPNYTYIPRDDSWGPDYEKTDIVIVDQYDQEALFLPTLTIKIDSINTRWIQFMQNPFNTVLKPQMNSNGTITRDVNGKMVPSHFEYAGAYDGSITISVNANDTIEREELVNLLHVIFAESGRDTLYMRGMFIKDVQTGGHTEVEYRNDFIFQQAVTLQTYSEWRRIIPVGDTLSSIGFQMNVKERLDSEVAPTETTGEPLPIYDLETTPYVIDPETNEPVLVCFMLDAQNTFAPTSLVFNTTTSEWEVSSFWQMVLEDTMIPFENLEMDINKEDPVTGYLNHAARAILQATAARAIAASQGRLLADGTKILPGGTYVYTNGKVELKNFSNENPVIQSTIVETQNTPTNPTDGYLESDDDIVIFRLFQGERNKSILVAKNIELDADGKLINGDLFKRVTELSGAFIDNPVISSGDVLLDGTSYSTMSAVDFLMILQFGEQPYRHTLGQITDAIDQVLNQLANVMLPISNRMAKTVSLVNIKEELMRRAEQFLLRNPVGL